MVAPDDIPLAMFTSIGPQTAGAAACPALCKLMDAAADDDDRSVRLKKQLRAARSYSLIDGSSSESIVTMSMHRLVQDVQRRQLAREPATWEDSVRLVASLLARAMPGVGDAATFEEAEAVAPLLTHVHSLLTGATLSTREMPTGLVPAQLLDEAAGARRRRGEYEMERELQEALLREKQAKKGEEHPHTLSAKGELASALSNSGQHAEAEEKYREVLEVTRRVLGEEHPDTLMAKGNLAYGLSKMDKHAEAVEMYRTVQPSMRRVLGDEDPETLTVMNNLADSFRELGNHKKALKKYGNVLEARRRVLGEEHPDTLRVMASLASALCDTDQYAEALEMSRTVVATMRRVLGEKHPETLLAMNIEQSAVNRIDVTDDTA